MRPDASKNSLIVKFPPQLVDGIFPLRRLDEDMPFAKRFDQFVEATMMKVEDFVLRFLRVRVVRLTGISVNRNHNGLKYVFKTFLDHPQ